MKNLLIVATVVIVACSPSEEVIQAAIAQTEAARPTKTAIPPTESPTTQPPVSIATENGDPNQVPANTTEAPTQSSIPQASIPDPRGYRWEEVARGFDQPLDLTHAGDGSGRIFVVEKSGQIHILVDGQVLPIPYLDIRERVGSQKTERGLLGLVFHPKYTINGFFYVNYTDLNGDTVIARFQVSSAPNVADTASEMLVLKVIQTNINHNGGGLAFGPDDYLYIGLGDGGGNGDLRGNGQNLNTLLGKMLRIDVDGGNPYAIPADNPFAVSGGLPEIWFYGLRNPWRFSFDTLTGDLYIADVGEKIWEEVNFIPSGSLGGANFGWNYREGGHVFEDSLPTGLSLVYPVVEYDHSDRYCSIIGGYVYRGKQLLEWSGVYLYGDYCSGAVWGLVKNSEDIWVSQLLFDLHSNISSFGLDEDGELYSVGQEGIIYRFVAVP